MKITPSQLALKPGDLISIVCTARKVPEVQLIEAKKMIESWGYKVRYGDSVGKSWHQLGGNDDERRNDLQKQMDDPEIRGIMIARGGYGTVRLLELLNPDGLKKNPKWICGFSDVTALHGWVHRHTGIPTLHCTMPLLFETASDSALVSLRHVLSGNPQKLNAAPHELNQTGSAEGILVGGNLSVLMSIRGTPAFPDLKSAILAIEDIDEYLYHIDRILRNLDYGGQLKQIAGLIVGGMTDMDDHDLPFGGTAESLVADVMQRYKIPVAYNMPFGHLADNQAMVLGVPVRLTVTAENSLLEYKRD